MSMRFCVLAAVAMWALVFALFLWPTPRCAHAHEETKEVLYGGLVNLHYETVHVQVCDRWAKR